MNKIFKWNKTSLMGFLNSHIVSYPTPINLNSFWSFSFSVCIVALVIQIIVGLILIIHYIPDFDLAFKSVEHIMRDVNNGWLLRYLHANGASIFFIVIYLHMARGIYYDSYFFPRKQLWISGIFIFISTCFFDVSFLDDGINDDSSNLKNKETKKKLGLALFAFFVILSLCLTKNGACGELMNNFSKELTDVINVSYSNIPCWLDIGNVRYFFWGNIPIETVEKIQNEAFFSDDVRIFWNNMSNYKKNHIFFEVFVGKNRFSDWKGMVWYFQDLLCDEYFSKSITPCFWILFLPF